MWLSVVFLELEREGYGEVGWVVGELEKGGETNRKVCWRWFDLSICTELCETV